MYDNAAQPVTGVPVETLLRDDLVRGDAMIGTIGPVLKYLLGNDDHALFSDEVVARVRGMLGSLARQLLDELESAAEQPDSREHDPAEIRQMVEAMAAHRALLGHVHALALEWQLAERVEHRLRLDPVLSPLLQALIASPDSGTARTAMALLAAQARFAQGQRRMELPLGELPGDLLHAALLMLRNHAGAELEAQVASARAETALRERYDESRTRLGLLARLVGAMGGGALAALAAGHAGIALFLSALAVASGQDRDMAVLATAEGQEARLALALRAAGLKPGQVAEQTEALCGSAHLLPGFELIDADRAATLLAASVAYPGI